MKKFFLVAAIIAVGFTVKAQSENAGIEGFKIQGGLNLGIPANHMGGSSFVAGIDVLGQYGVSENFAITADAGFSAIFLKSTADPKTESLIPIRLGVRYYPASNFYFGGKIGVGLLAYDGHSTSTTAYSFGGGYLISPKIDLGASYDGYSKNGSFGLINFRIGYTFN